MDCSQRSAEFLRVIVGIGYCKAIHHGKVKAIQSLAVF